MPMSIDFLLASILYAYLKIFQFSVQSAGYIFCILRGGIDRLVSSAFIVAFQCTGQIVNIKEEQRRAKA